MRVFLTGASGWIGSAAAQELLSAGHHVVGMARSDSSAATLRDRGLDVRRGDLDDLDGLREAAADADAVVHLANKHDFEHPEVSNRAERDAVAAIGDTLEGSGKTFILASGVAALAQGRPATEQDHSPHHGLESPRGGSENLALEYVARGVNTVSARFAPTVHGAGDHGFIAALVAIARDQGVSGYPGDGTNRWSAVHRSDAGRLVARALESAPAGSLLHAVAEEGVPTRAIAEAIGSGLSLPARSIDPADVTGHFGWIGAFFAMDLTASSTLTRASLGWEPSGPALLGDLAGGFYFGG